MRVSMETAVILAGGKSLRLIPLTLEIPKTLVEVNGKPIIYWIVRWLGGFGVKHIVMAVAYKKDEIIRYMKENSSFGLAVEFSEDPGRGQMYAYKLAIDRFVKDENFIAMNADELTNMDLSKLVDMHAERKPIVTMAVAPFSPRFGIVRLGDHGKVVGFEYGKRLKDVPVNMGIYIFNRKITDYIPGPDTSEDVVYGKLAKVGGIAAHMLADGEEWSTVNTVKDVQEAEASIRKWGWGEKRA